MKPTILFVSAAVASMFVVSVSGSRGFADPAGGATSTARIVVKVELSGTAPAPTETQASADPCCSQAHQTAPLLSQEVRVGAAGALVDALVFVKDGLSETYPPSQTPVTLDLKACAFLPHVIGMMAGQPLQMVNGDSTLHTIHPMPVVNAAFNIALPIPGRKQDWVFAKPEPAFRIKCDVHPWESAFIATFAHPFFGVTNSKGTVELANLPAGTFQLQVWHEKYGVQVQAVSVAAGEVKPITFSFKAGA